MSEVKDTCGASTPQWLNRRKRRISGAPLNVPKRGSPKRSLIQGSHDAWGWGGGVDVVGGPSGVTSPSLAYLLLCQLGLLLVVALPGFIGSGRGRLASAQQEQQQHRSSTSSPTAAARTERSGQVHGVRDGQELEGFADAQSGRFWQKNPKNKQKK